MYKLCYAIAGRHKKTPHELYATTSPFYAHGTSTTNHGPFSIDQKQVFRILHTIL